MASPIVPNGDMSFICAMKASSTSGLVVPSGFCKRQVENAVMVDPKSGLRYGASDPRRGGEAVGW